MTSRRLVSGLMVVAAVAGASGGSVPAPTLTMDDGVFVMRLVATLEDAANGRDDPAKGRDSPIRYRPLADLLAMRDATTLGKDVTLIDSENGLFRGYVLRVTAQGSRFEASLVPDSRGCGLAFFIDERILIYTGRGLGCDKKTLGPER
jgi:hypothetical protein